MTGTNSTQPGTYSPAEPVDNPNQPDYESVRILRLQPGDTLVVRLGYSPSEADKQRIREQLGAMFPKHQQVVLGPDTDLEVLRTEHTQGGGGIANTESQPPPPLAT